MIPNKFKLTNSVKTMESFELFTKKIRKKKRGKFQNKLTCNLCSILLSNLLTGNKKGKDLEKFSVWTWKASFLVGVSKWGYLISENNDYWWIDWLKGGVR